MSDRTVHAKLGDCEIVRYDRAGKWCREYVPAKGRPYTRLSLDAAVNEAYHCVQGGGDVYFQRPGGKAFDARIRKLILADV